MNTNKPTWQLQTAKNKFSELVNKALDGRPQLVTKNGIPAVYVVEAESYQRLKRRKNQSLKELILASPHKNLEIVTERDRSDTGREIEL